MNCFQKKSDFFQQHHEGTTKLSDYWALHGGAHRILIPRLFFITEYEWFQGQNHFLIISSYITVVFTCLLFCIIFLKNNTLTTKEKLFLSAFSITAIFSSTQLENFLYTFDIQWFLTASGALLACYYFSAFLNNPSKTLFILFVTAALFSSYSSFSGFILWICFPLVALLNRQYKISLLLFSVLVLMGFIYLPGIGGAGPDFSKLDIEIPPWYILLAGFFYSTLRYLGGFLGAPLSKSHLIIAGSIAWLAIFYFLALCFFYWKKSQPNKHIIFSITTTLFALGVASSTAVGRSFTPNSFAGDRYQTIVIIFWLGLFLLLYFLNKDKPKRKLITITLMLVWSFSLGAYSISSIKDFSKKTSLLAQAESAVLAHAYSYKAVRQRITHWDLLGKRNYPKQHGDFLQKQQWGIFGSPYGQLVGKPITQINNQTTCLSNINTIQKSPMNYLTNEEKLSNPLQDFKITGSAWYPKNKKPLPAVLIVNNDNIVTGVGLLQRPDGYLWSLKSLDDKSWWLGYSKGNVHDPITLYGWDDGNICFLQKTTLTPQ